MCDEATQQCSHCTAETDSQLCARLAKQCGAITATDLCGTTRAADCGTCSGGRPCDSATNTCIGPCQDTETAQEFCARLHRACGRAEGDDTCGQPRVVDSCGDCGATGICTADGQCCTPETDAELCTAANIACGPATATDRCAQPRAIESCGSCLRGDLCLADGQCCTPDTDTALCAAAHRNCGPATATDQCGQARTIASCGTCASGGDLCLADGQCCTPETDVALCAAAHRTCGPATATDHCGQARTIASCGTCAGGGDLCLADGQCCTPETDAALCAAAHRTCGPATATDHCGQARTIASCGTCAGSGDLCLANGQCCTPETDAQLCATQHRVCGRATATDRCGQARTVASCGDCGSGGPTDVCLANGTCCVAETDAAICQSQNRVCGPAASFVDHCARPRTVASCGSCPNASDVCLAAGECCTPETDAEICQAQNKLCGTATATDRCGTARTVASCGSCPAGEACNALFYCSVPGVPLNDSCASPEAIILSTSGQATWRGDTTNATDSLPRSLNCSASGPDVVYLVTLANASDLEVTLAFDDPTIFAALAVRTVCADVSSELRCRPPAPGPQTSKLWNVPAGPVYIWVDAARLAPYEGEFTLTVNATTPPRAAQANDGCAGATALSFVNDVATAAGDTTWARDDYSSSMCVHTLDGPDLVYSFTLAADAAVTIALTPTAGDTFFEPGFYLRGQCTTSTQEQACSAEWSGTPAPPIQRSALPAGTWYVIVDGREGTYGGFTLTVTRAAADPDSCPLAQTLTFNSAQVAEVTGDTTHATNDAGGSCNSSGTGTSYGNDLVYTFTLGAAHDVEVLVTPTGTTAWQPAVYLRSTCADASSEVGCIKATAAGQPARLALSQLAAGPWAVFVDGAINSTKGPFDLKITWSDPVVVVNDTCAGAPLLTLTNGQVSVLGDDTSFAADDYQGSCAPAGGGAGRDVVYSFGLADRAWVTAAVTRAASATSFLPVVYLQLRNCGSAADEVACAASPTGTGSGTATLNATNLGPGTYYVVVDGASGTSGAFDLSITARTAIDNDTCTSPKVLTVDASGNATASSDTTLAHDDAAAKSGCTGGAGHDLVYAVDVTGPKVIQATLTAAPSATGYKPALFIRAACDDASTTAELACSASAIAGGSTSTATTALGTGRYFIWVDGANGTNGAFTLQVSVSDPPPSNNDTCSGAEALAFDTKGSVVVTGDTSGKANDYNGTCGASGLLPGGDVVYTFTLAADAWVAARLTADPGSASYRPALYLRRTTCTSALAADEVFCARATLSTSPPPTMQARLLTQGTYFLIVDGNTSTNGRFTLEVESHINSNCTQARALQFDASGVATATGDTRLGTNDDEAPSWCNSRTTNEDLVYAFTLGADRQVAVQVAPATGSSLRPTVYLRSTCERMGAQVGSACAKTTTTGATVSLTLPVLAAGTYFVWVDSYGNNGGTTKVPYTGPFTLTVTTSAPAAGPANDACAGAIDLGLGGGVIHASVTGDTSNATDSGTGSCRAGIAPDVVYSFTTGAAQKVTATLTRSSSSNMMLYLRDSCAQGAPPHEVTCASSYLATTTNLTVNELPAGTWYLWVDGWGVSSAGAFTLTVDLAASTTVYANEGCRSPEGLNFDATGLATTTGTTVGATSESSGGASCASFVNAPDLAYTFDLRSDQKVTATVTPTAASPNFKPAVYIRRACDSLAGADELVCGSASTAGPIAVEVKRAAAGTYWLWVDGYSSSDSGAFTLTVKADPPATVPANDRCSGAIALPSGGSTLSGDTSLALADYGWGPFSAACGPNLSTPAADLVYTFTPATSGSYTASVTPTGSWSPSVWVTTSCGDETACVALAQATSGATANAVFTGTAGTTYYVIVDGFSTSASYAGAFSVKVQ